MTHTFTLDGESIDIDQFILDNCFEADDIEAIWGLGVGYSIVYGGGAFALFTLARIS